MYFYPLIITTKKRSTAPENWTELPVSCCGQRAPCYPQCTTSRLHQRHNTMLTPRSLMNRLNLPFPHNVCVCVCVWTVNSDISLKDWNKKCVTHISPRVTIKQFCVFTTCFLAFNPSGTSWISTDLKLNHQCFCIFWTLPVWINGCKQLYSPTLTFSLVISCQNAGERLRCFQREHWFKIASSCFVEIPGCFEVCTPLSVLTLTQWREPWLQLFIHLVGEKVSPMHRLAPPPPLFFPSLKPPLPFPQN